MIKINGKSGELDVTGTVNELTVEIAMVIYYLAVDYQQNKNTPLEDSIAYFTNRVKATPHNPTKNQRLVYNLKTIIQLSQITFAR